jgi:hypothetical protein
LDHFQSRPLRNSNDAIPRQQFHEQAPGLIDYNGQIEVNRSLLNVVLHDKPEISKSGSATAAK